MLIPLGVLDFETVPPAGGAYDLLETEIVSAGPVSSVTFSSISSTYGSSYQHLQIRSTLLTNTSNQLFVIHFNADTGSNYSRHYLEGNGAGAVGSSGEINQSSMYYAFWAGTVVSDKAVASVCDILDPFETGKYSTIRSFMGHDGTVALYSGLWMNTDAIDSITITSVGGSRITDNSRISLYGRGA